MFAREIGLCARAVEGRDGTSRDCTYISDRIEARDLEVKVCPAQVVLRIKPGKAFTAFPNLLAYLIAFEDQR